MLSALKFSPRLPFVFCSALTLLAGGATSSAWAQNESAANAPISAPSGTATTQLAQATTTANPPIRVRPPREPIISRSNFTLHFTKPDIANKNDAALRISQPVATSGCLQILMPDVQTMEEGHTLWVTVGRPRIRLDRSEPYSHNNCAQASDVAKTDLILNKDHLQKNNIKIIRFKNDFGMDTYDVEVGEHYIRLSPQTSTLFAPSTMQGSGADPLTHWFYPKETVILSIPALPQGESVNRAVTRLATSQGMIPLHDSIRAFDPPKDGARDLYFIDHSGLIVNDLAYRENKSFGTIILPETYHGAQDTFKAPRRLEIYARRP